MAAKEKMMKKRKEDIHPTILIYSFLMLSLMIIACWILIKRIPQQPLPSQQDTSPNEKYVYVYADPLPSDSETVEESTGWLVREHEKKIGVFSSDGVLLELLEIYTNTLPQADQRLLREGISVQTRSDLYSLIEDYSE